ncbi:MAG: hypothetical protein ACOC1F_09490, partial [Myxococcota bacterium]
MVDAAPSSVRFALLEFLFADRYSQFRSKCYAFLLGQARALDVPAQWFCGWAPPGRDSRKRYVIDLEEDAWEPILDAIEAFAPTHLILSEKLDTRLQRALEQRLPNVVVDNLADAPDERVVYTRVGWLPRWLGLREGAWAPFEQRFILDACEPCYETRCVPPPPGVPTPAPPPVHVAAGPECVYQRPLAHSRFFQDVSLSPGVRPFGCSFCVGPGSVDYAFETPAIELALKQCLAALSCRDRCSSTTDYVIDGGAVSLRVGSFFRGILAHPFPPSRFYFAYRIDELARVGPQLDKVLPAMAEAGHRIAIYNMGVENFSEAENERLNKGLCAADIDALTERVAEWERRFPQTFEFTQKGGFGLILYTPWTTLEDLNVNLSRMRRPGVGTEGFALTAKLQILPNAAIAELARRDGALADSFDDFHYYDSGCFYRHDQRELPWRFLHPEVGALYKVGCRVVPITEFGADDELFARVQALYKSRPDVWCDSLEFFADALRVTAEAPSPQGPEEILERMRAQADTRPKLRSQGRVPREHMPRSTTVMLASRLSELLLPDRGKRYRFGGFEISSIDAKRDDTVRIS